MSWGVLSPPERLKYGVRGINDISKSYFRNYLNLMVIYYSDPTLPFNVGF